MIKFFRIIRQKALTENKFGKYLTYAIGEIILVVIGILVAVAINDWNTTRDNQKNEREILVSLQKEYLDNLKEIEEKILMRNLTMESIEFLMTYIDQGIANIPLDTISLHFSHTQYDPTFDPAMGVTMELINSGKLYLLTNAELKNRLTTWSSKVDKLSEQEQLTVGYINNRYIPYLIENFETRHFSDSKRNEQMDNIFSMGESRTFSIYRELRRDVFDKYIRDREVENYLIYIGNFTYIANRQSEGIKEEIKTILRIIDSELNIN